MFNKNLKNIRLQQGLSQKRVAEYLMVSPQSVSKWEKGEALPSIEYLPKLAEILNCDINAFFKPITKNVLDSDFFSRLFELSYEYIYKQKDVDEELNLFFVENPCALELLENFETEVKQYQIIKNKNIADIFGCTAELAAVIIGLLIKHEMIEKLENEDSYFVLKDNVGGLRIVLKMMREVCKHKFNS